MAKTLITVAGTKFYYGFGVFEPGMKVRLVKEPDNEHDREAIRVEVPGLGRVGYVANSSFTVKGESMSAGRLYDRIGDTAKAKVVIAVDGIILCKVSKKSLLANKGSVKSCADDEDLAF